MSIRENQLQKKNAGLKRKKKGIRVKISGTAASPRLCITRTLQHIYGQIIDDVKGVTLISASSLTKDLSTEIKGKKKTEIAFIVGKYIGTKAREKNIAPAVIREAEQASPKL